MRLIQNHINCLVKPFQRSLQNYAVENYKYLPINMALTALLTIKFLPSEVMIETVSKINVKKN